MSIAVSRGTQELSKKHLWLLIGLFFPPLAFSQSISGDTKLLSLCEGRYLFVAHLAQINNNEGLAKNLMLRASRVTTAHLFLNERNGKVSGETMNEIKAVRRAEKPSLDASPDRAVSLADECDKTTPRIVASARNIGKSWNGKKFDEWQQMIFEQYIRSMGIR